MLYIHKWEASVVAYVLAKQAFIMVSLSIWVIANLIFCKFIARRIQYQLRFGCFSFKKYINKPINATWSLQRNIEKEGLKTFKWWIVDIVLKRKHLSRLGANYFFSSHLGFQIVSFGEYSFFFPFHSFFFFFHLRGKKE